MPGYKGTGGLTFFQDALTIQDPSQPTTSIGSNWEFHSKCPPSPMSDPIAAAFANIGASTFDGANAVLWQYNGSGAAPNTSQKGVYVPRPTYTNDYGLNQQFVQIQLLKQTSLWQGGLVIEYDAATGQLTTYALNISGAGVNWGIQKWVNGVGANLVTGGGIVLPATLRLSVDLTTPGQATITAKQGGVLLGSAVDNTAPVLVRGGGGLVSLIASQAGNFEMRNYQGGAGL